MTGLKKYNTRILPPEEWDKLKGTEADPAYLNFDPQYTNVIIVECSGIIVGCWCLFPVYHAECVWIREEHQGNPVVAGRLVKGMMQMAKEIGLKNLVTSSLSEEIDHLITSHLKGKLLPGRPYIFPVKSGT